MHEISGLTACPMCDTLYLRARLKHGQRARCRVCSAELDRHSRLDRRQLTPLVLSCLLFFIIANVFPIVAIEMQGGVYQLTLSGALLHLLKEGMLPVAVMVFLPTLLLPGLYLSLLFVLLVSGRSVLSSRRVNRLVRFLQQIYPWSMVEVFLLGVLVAIIKLSSISSIIVGPALWAWMATTMTLTLVLTFDLRLLVQWPTTGRRADGLRSLGARYHASRPAVPREEEGHRQGLSDDAHRLVTGQDGHLLTTAGSVGFCARRLGVITCHHCDSTWAEAREGGRCGHCGASLRRRKPGGLGVTWALLITAMILYIPANLMPVMTTSTLFGSSDSTILSGVVYFWQDGEWVLAAVIFIASFLIPLFKLGALVLLTALTQARSLWRLRERTHLYDIVEWVGRWSMLDVFVVAVTSSLVQVPGVAVIRAGPGIAAFGAVVVLTMLATMSFDPRRAWDARFSTAYESRRRGQHGRWTQNA